MCIPSGVTEVERRAVEETVMQAGAKEVVLMEEPMAARYRRRLTRAVQATGSMVVDIGGGTTEVAVISLGGIVCVSASIRIAGNALGQRYCELSEERNIQINIGDKMAEDIKAAIGVGV